MLRKLEVVVVGGAANLHSLEDCHDSFHGLRAAVVGQQAKSPVAAFPLTD